MRNTEGMVVWCCLVGAKEVKISAYLILDFFIRHSCSDDKEDRNGH